MQAYLYAASVGVLQTFLMILISLISVGVQFHTTGPLCFSVC